METQKQCLQCGRPLRGRSDKKFCDDGCRNTFNNQLKTPDSNLVRNINHALIKNRRILSSFLDRSPESGIVKVSRTKLLEQHFIFTYHTHTYTNKNGQVYFFIYDCGYLPLEGDMYLLVRRKAH